MNKNLPLVLFALLFIIACKQNIIDPSEEYHLPKGEVALKTLPCGQATLYFVSSFVKWYSKDLDLYSIENGFDSLQLRIWFINEDNQTDSSFHLLLFKKAKNKSFTATLVDFAYPLNGGVPDIDTLPIVKYAFIPFQPSLLNFLDSSIYFLLEYGGISTTCKKPLDERISINKIIVELALEGKYYLGQFPIPSDFKQSCSHGEEKWLIKLLSLLKEAYNYTFINDYLK